MSSIRGKYARRASATGVVLGAVAILLLLGLQAAAAQPPEAMSAVREELLRMRDEDQAARNLRFDTDEDIATLQAVDTRNTARLKQIIEAHGWPTIAQVGEDAANAAWLLAQHADADPAFQREVLALMAVAVDAGQASASNYAYLWDRVHDPQRYGTQGRCVGPGQWAPRAIESPDGVDDRRAGAGLPPMADYIARVSGHCPDRD